MNTETYTVEVFKGGKWIQYLIGLDAESANFHAGIIYRNSNLLHRTVRESNGVKTHGLVK